MVNNHITSVGVVAPYCINCTAVIRSFIREIVVAGCIIIGVIKAGSFNFHNLARTNMGDSTIKIADFNFHRDLINLIFISFFIVNFVSVIMAVLRIQN